MTRTAEIKRKTAETIVDVRLDLDGTGLTDVATGIVIFDHLLTSLGRHTLFDLFIHAEGDLHIDAHHTIEDVGIVLGRGLHQALGDKRGITRFGHAILPMDESRVEAAVDLCGRGFLAFDIDFERPMLGDMDTQLVEEFFRALTTNGQFTLHLCRRAGHNTHHVAEAAFKAAARALRMAVELDARQMENIPSTKGIL